jgi:hypothetical protein
MLEETERAKEATATDGEQNQPRRRAKQGRKKPPTEHSGPREPSVLQELWGSTVDKLRPHVPLIALVLVLLMTALFVIVMTPGPRKK